MLAKTLRCLQSKRYLPATRLPHRRPSHRFATTHTTYSSYLQAPNRLKRSHSMAMVPYNCDAYFRMYEPDFNRMSDNEMARVDNNSSSMVSDRLQVLLESAREANREQRVPLEDFLASLQREQGPMIPAQDEDIKASLCKLACSFRLKDADRTAIYGRTD